MFHPYDSLSDVTPIEAASTRTGKDGLSTAACTESPSTASSIGSRKARVTFVTILPRLQRRKSVLNRDITRSVARVGPKWLFEGGKTPDE